jgi:penicillin-insensitive murein endopeptidase
VVSGGTAVEAPPQKRHRIRVKCPIQHEVLMPCLTRLLLASLLLAGSCAQASPPDRSAGGAVAADQFAAVRTATAGPARVFGTYTNGCIAGAVQLEPDSAVWQVLKPSRNRAWGHPTLVRLVEELARKTAGEGHRGLLVGDLAQPRGGPTPSDHNSHQSGLDADIWLTPLPDRRLSPEELERFTPPSMVDLETARVATAFGAVQHAMLRHAAEHPDVERIFVSPPIKQALCERTQDADRAWLRKIRPWRGHTAHMHVRIACPADSDGCEDQKPVPDGDGCGSELASWMTDTSWRQSRPRPHVPEKGLTLGAMPDACRRLLH